MRRFVKKPLMIEAFLYGIDDFPEWMELAIPDNLAAVHLHADAKENYMLIRTLEGTMRANYGDYIIKGIKGEIYPCKAKIFEESYDELHSYE